MYAELVHVVDEARLMIHRSMVVVERMHAGEGVTVPMRAVLEFLRTHDPHTVAAIARERSVSRQHVQTIVNDLLDAELVERSNNPNHRRAPLIGLTAVGEQTIDRLHARERDAFEPELADDARLTASRLADAADVLSAIGLGLERIGAGLAVEQPDAKEDAP